MDWFNFNDKEFRIFFFIVLALFLFIAVFVLTAIVSAQFVKKRKDAIKAESNTLRIYVINIKENSVLYFNRSNLKDKTKMTLSEFYEKFHPNDMEKVKSWIGSICIDKSSAEEYLEADTLLEHQKTSFSLLKLVKFDEKNGIIHIENHILRYITPANYITHRKRGILTGVVKRSTMNQIISKYKSIYGFTFAIRFFYIKQKALTDDKVESYMVMSLKNEVYPYISGRNQRQIVELSNSEMLLFDLRINNKDDAMHLASSIAHNINKAISLNSFTGQIGFAIGIVENAQYYQDFDTIVQHAQEACISAQQSNVNVLLFQKTTSPELDLAQYRDNIANLMHSKNMRYLFRPIVDINKKSILGYFEYVKAYNSPFTSFVEISRYAEKVDANRDILAVAARGVIPKFYQERPNQKCRLFFEISLLDVKNVMEILPQIPNSQEVTIVLTFKEQEVNENSSDIILLNDSFAALHAAGYELALSADDKDLLLEPSIYYNFDYFIAGANMIGEIKKNNRVRLSIHTLIEQLLKYRKPIIATDLEGWQAIELIVKSGITLLSAEAISSSSDMLLPVDRKTMEKLGKLGETYK